MLVEPSVSVVNGHFTYKLLSELSCELSVTFALAAEHFNYFSKYLPVAFLSSRTELPP